MTPLRRRMLEDMQLRGFSARTQECYARRPPARGALSPEPRPAHGGRSAPVLPVSGQRQEGRAHDGDDRVVRDSVLLRADAPPGVDDAPVRAAGPRAQAAGGDLPGCVQDVSAAAVVTPV